MLKNIRAAIAAARHEFRPDEARGQTSAPGDELDTLLRLLATATVASDTDRRDAKNCLQCAAALLGIELSPKEPGAAGHASSGGGLAPWQVKRVQSHIENNLNSCLRAADLAGIVRLSTSHFFRAFRKSFGEAPLAYIMRRRILRAQQLMLSSQRSLLEIALECGMCNQAHFTRVFYRIVGINPSAWRRQFLVSPPLETVAGTAPIAERSTESNTRKASCLSK